MKVDLSKVKLRDLDGNLLGDKEKGVGTHTSVARILYNKATNLDLVDIALNMNKGLPVEMAASHIQEMRKLVADPANGFFAFARKAIFEYLDDLEDAEKKKQAKKNK